MNPKRAELIATIQVAIALARENGSDMTGYLLETALAEELSPEREKIAEAKGKARPDAWTEH